MSLLSFLSLRRFKKKNIRKFQRVRIPLLVRYHLEGESEGKISNLRDLAAGGIRFTTDEPVRLGARLRLKVKLPWRERPLDVVGKVTRCAKVKDASVFRIATQFVGMKREDVAEIETFVDAMASQRLKRPKRG